MWPLRELLLGHEDKSLPALIMPSLRGELAVLEDVGRRKKAFHSVGICVHHKHAVFGIDHILDLFSTPPRSLVVVHGLPAMLRAVLVVYGAFVSQFYKTRKVLGRPRGLSKLNTTRNAEDE